MNARNDNATPGSTTSWWRWGTPPRSGMRRVVPPWEYRHLRGWAGVHFAAGIVLVIFGAVLLPYSWWATLVLVAAAPFSLGCWEMTIARSALPVAQPAQHILV
jgi:hypothetical protein